MHHEEVLETATQVVEKLLALADRLDDRAEVIVQQDDGRRLARAARAALAHGDADVSGLQRGDIVDAVTGHGDNLAVALRARARTPPSVSARHVR